MSNQLQISKINKSDLVKLLTNTTKSTVVNVEYVVDDKRSKVVNKLNQIQKHVKITHLYLNHDYTKKVQNLTNNSEFEAFELKGKTRLSSTVLISDKTNEFLLDGKILNSEVTEILGYYHNGNEITEAEGVALGLWTNSYYNPSPKKTSGRGTVSGDDDFKMITLGIKNIIKIKLNGVHYELID